MFAYTETRISTINGILPCTSGLNLTCHPSPKKQKKISLSPTISGINMESKFKIQIQLENRINNFCAIWKFELFFVKKVGS